MEYVPGGELYQHLVRVQSLCLSDTVFYSAQIVLAFEFLHKRKIAYRDLKPENILVGKDGYLKLADFGFAKEIPDRAFTLCGTPEYVAPEVLISKGHNWSADWWSFGVFLFELVCGTTPFRSENPMLMYEKIVTQNYEFPEGFDSKAKSLIHHLLEKDLDKRWGCLFRGVKDIKEHAFYDALDWGELWEKKLEVPWEPELESEFDTRHF